MDHRVVDLADEAATRALARELAPLAALVNNAGLFDERKFFDVSSDDYRRMYEVNLLAVATLTQEAARDMAPGGKIVNIASRAYLGAKNHPTTWPPRPRWWLYPRLGHGTGAARHSGQCDRARPDRHAAAAQPVARAAGRATGAAAHGRAGQPQDIANAVSFLAAPHMDFITGQVIFVDGGKSLGGSGA